MSIFYCHKSSSLLNAYMSSIFTDMPKNIYTSSLRTVFCSVFQTLFQRDVSQIILRNYKVHTISFFALASGNEDGQQLALCRYAVRQKVKKKEN